jgi:phenylacetate-CoA ligase
LEWVKEFQVVQKGYKDINLLIVPKGVVADVDKQRIEEKIRSLLGEECQVEWEFVREILRTPQGKYRYLMSLVHD